MKHFGNRDDRYGWINRRGRNEGSAYLHLNDLGVAASAEWVVFRKGHGVGFTFGRNGAESDVGLDIYAGPLFSVWLRFRSPWTKWLKVKDRTAPRWYEPRHTGIRLHTGEYRALVVQVDTAHKRRGDPWWREIVINRTKILGRVRHDSTVDGTGETVVPMPEGPYPATWCKKTTVRRYVRFPGTLLDRVRGPRTSTHVMLDIPGGIPHWGKGENSWDCGMDGTCGTGGATVWDAVANAVRATMRDRERHGPESLPRPMTITEAEAHFTGGR